MCRCAFNVLLFVAILGLVQQELTYPQSAGQPASPAWLDSSGETTGIKNPTRRLQPFSLQNQSGLPVETEQEEVKVDAQTTRIERRSYMTSVNGDRQLTETVVEEVKKMPGDRIHAVRTVSRKDSSGRFSPVQKEIQDMGPSGQDSYVTKKTLLFAGVNGALVEREQVQQTERRTGEKSVEIDRIQYVPGTNGGWTPLERRVSQNKLGEERNQSDEQVYQYDVNNKLSLTRQIQTIEWKDGAGRHRQSDSFVRDLQGKLQLDSRTTIIQTPQGGGQQVTTETLEKASPTAPNEGLKVVRRIVENAKVVSPKQTEKQLEVLDPDTNGAMRTTYSQQSTETK